MPVFFEPTDPQKSVKALASPFATAIKYASPNIHELRFMAAESGQEHYNAASGKEGIVTRSFFFGIFIYIICVSVKSRPT